MSDVKKKLDPENLEHQYLDSSSSSPWSSASTIICTPLHDDASFNEDNQRHFSSTISEASELDDQLDVNGNQKLAHYDVLQLANLDDHRADGKPRIPRMILRKTVENYDRFQNEILEAEEVQLRNYQSWNYEYDRNHGSYDVIYESPYFLNTRLIIPHLTPIVLKPIKAEERQQVDNNQFDKVFDANSKVKEEEPPRIASTSTMTLAMESLALLHDPYRDFHYVDLESAARVICGPQVCPEEPICADVLMVEVSDVDDDHDDGNDSATTIVDVEEVVKDKEEDNRQEDPKPVTRRRGRPPGRSLGRFHNLEKRELHPRVKKVEAVVKISESILPTRKYSRKIPKENPKKNKLSQKNQEKKNSKKTNRNQKQNPDLTPKQKGARLRTYMRIYNMKNRLAKKAHALKKRRSCEYNWKRLIVPKPVTFRNSLRRR